MAFNVESSNAVYSSEFIEANYEYQYTTVQRNDNKIRAISQTEKLQIRTERKVPRLGVMLVGWGGNNGSTLTAALLANKHGLSWRTKTGVQKANWYGSLTQAATIRLGTGENGQEVYVPISSVLPMVNPDDVVVDGWDISDYDLAESMKRAEVLYPLLQDQLEPYMAEMKPRKSIYIPSYIAQNQALRANNILEGSRMDMVDQICNDIEDFKIKSGVDKIIVVWTANTERFCRVQPGYHDTKENLKLAIQNDNDEISPSTLFAYASILKKCPYINGSPQNTFVPGLVEFAESEGVFIAGDDFKSGQTKIKSVLVDFLVSAGIKPVSIVSYNHLGNNDGKNLSGDEQFKSKEISKSNVVDDMVDSNRILYSSDEKPDHCVVIKYVPYVGDSKRAMDEYISEIMMGGKNTLIVHNTCEDSLLASPIILDLVILCELFSRVKFRKDSNSQYESFHPVMSILSYLCKAPVMPKGAPVINALFKQRSCIDNVLRACIGLPPDNNMLLEYKVPFLMNTCIQKSDDHNSIVQNGKE